MKKIIYILAVLALMVSFSSCTKTETEGFEEATIQLRSKVDPDSNGIDSITEEEAVRSDRNLRGEGELDEEITDDDDDDEEGDNMKSK
ncbi:MAG: hypothetical protein AB8B53_00535 [Flavobacteriales bacterium]